MSTECELLANQTQSLDEVLERLAARDEELIEPTHIPDTGVDSLTVAVECLKSMADLYLTISKEGVSQADVQALRAIQSRMQPYARLDTKVALEAYEGLFTPTRSMINQTVSQEAALAEIGHTLKEWFFILVDFVIRVVDWCRRVWNSEDTIRARLKTMDNYMQSLYNQFNMVLKYNQSMGRDSAADLLALGTVILNDPKLERSESTLCAFNVGTTAFDIKAADKDIDRNFNTLMKDVASLKTHIEQNKPGSIGYDYGLEINITAEALEDILVANIDNETFLKTIRPDFWLRPKQLVTRVIFAPSHNIEQVQRLAKDLRSIRRNSNFDALKEVDVVVQNIEHLTKAISGLERVIKFKQKLYSDYYKASASYANFYIRAYEFLMEEIKTKSAADFDQVVVDRLSKGWDDLLAKMGI